MAVTMQTLPRQERSDNLVTLLATAVVVVLALLALGVLAVFGLTQAQRGLDAVRYGTPRTVQVSGYVGHHETAGLPTHFIALNLDGQVSVLEIPGGDIEQLAVLPGPYVVGADGPSVVPELDLRDLTGDGHVDLLITLRGETVVYVNADGGFRLMTPAKRGQVMDAHDGQE